MSNKTDVAPSLDELLAAVAKGEHFSVKRGRRKLSPAQKLRYEPPCFIYLPDGTRDTDADVSLREHPIVVKVKHNQDAAQIAQHLRELANQIETEGIPKRIPSVKARKRA